MRQIAYISRLLLLTGVGTLSACAGLKERSEVTILKGPNMPTGVYNMGYATDGKIIYCVGGVNLWKTTKHATDDIYLYSPVVDKWERGNFFDKRTEKEATSSVYLDDLNVIFSTGFAYLPKENFYTFPIEILDLRDYSVRYRSDNPHMAIQSSVVYWNKKVYVFGGLAYDSEGNSFYADRLVSFDPYTDQWADLSPMPAPRIAGGVVVDDFLYVFGGFDEKKVYDEIWRYHFVSDSWETIGYLPYPVSNAGISQRYPFVFLTNISFEQNVIGRFDTRNGAFREIRTSIASSSAGSVILGKYLYIFGGTTDDGATATNKMYKIPLSELMDDE